MGAAQQVLAAIGAGLKTTVGALFTSAQAANSQNRGMADFCNLTATDNIAVYVNATGGLSALRFVVSGTTITNPDAPFVISAVTTANSGQVCVTALSASKMLVVWSDTSTSIKAVVLSLAGAVLSIGTPLVIYSVASFQKAVSKISATQVAVAVGQSTGINSKILSISGTTVTAGANFLLTSDPLLDEPSLTVVDDVAGTAVLATHNNGGTFRPQMFELGFSGTAFTSVQLPSDVGTDIANGSVEVINNAITLGWVFSCGGAMQASSYVNAGGIVPSGNVVDVVGAGSPFYGVSCTGVARMYSAYALSGAFYGRSAEIVGSTLNYGTPAALPFASLTKPTRSVLMVADTKVMTLGVNGSNALCAVACTIG